MLFVQVFPLIPTLEVNRVEVVLNNRLILQGFHGEQLHQRDISDVEETDDPEYADREDSPAPTVMELPDADDMVIDEDEIPDARSDAEVGEEHSESEGSSEDE